MGHKYDKAKSEIKFDSKPKYDTKTKVDDVESKDKDKLKEDIATTTTITTTSDNPETIDQTILPITNKDASIKANVSLTINQRKKRIATDKYLTISLANLENKSNPIIGSTNTI